MDLARKLGVKVKPSSSGCTTCEFNRCSATAVAASASPVDLTDAGRAVFETAADVGEEEDQR
jgi:hypothetical protein